MLFPGKDAAQVINIGGQVAPGDLLVQAERDYTLSGTGRIAGSGSVNKTGAGTLSLLTKIPIPVPRFYIRE